MIKINGELLNMSEIPLLEYLKKNGFSPERIAVERNEEIVSKSEYADCVLRDGDTVEIVSLVGGG